MGIEGTSRNKASVHVLASFPGFPSSFPSLAVWEKWSDGKLEGKPRNEVSIHVCGLSFPDPARDSPGNGTDCPRTGLGLHGQVKELLHQGKALRTILVEQYIKALLCTYSKCKTFQPQRPSSVDMHKVPVRQGPIH